MTFEEIKKLVLNEGKLARLPKFHPMEFIFWCPMDTLTGEVIQNAKSLPDQFKKFRRLIGEKSSATFYGYMAFHTNDGDVINGCRLSDEDKASDEWEILKLETDPKPQDLTWKEFMDQLPKAGPENGTTKAV